MKKMTIELLYPEFNNLFGDLGNAEYLEKKLKAAGYETETVKTTLFDEPYFIENEVDFLLIGPCQERHQIIELEKLRAYSDKIKERIDGGGIILATGNAFELFGEYIEHTDTSKTECLGFFPYHAEQFSRLRYNDCSVGEFDGMKITGFKNLLSHSHGELPHPFLKMLKGCGMNKDTDIEGIHYNNLFATYLIGPVLPLNPQFTDYLISLADGEYSPVEFPFEKEAYEKRIAELLKD